MATKTAKSTEETPKKSKKKLLIIVVVLLVVGAAAAYFLVLKKKPASKTKVAPVAITYTMPSITTNLDDSNIVQVQMILELAPGDTKTEIAKDLPKLNNAAILAFGGMSYNQLLPTSGRTQAAAALTQAFNQVLHSGAKPWDTVDGILFSNFIVQ